jgi:calcineurin-like phosphoesterase family protein
MADIFLISDTHFGHNNIISYCGRPFKNTEEMDYHMIDRWNSVVKPQDKVYHLGDVYMGLKRERLEWVLGSLNGHKRLILGNHDNGKDQVLQRYFEKIDVWRMFPEFGLLLTHVPVHSSALEAKELKNIHGHIHQNPSPGGPYKCVCVEQINYTPVNVEDLRIR